MLDRWDDIVATTILPVDPASPAQARRFVADVLHEVVRPVDMAVVTLLTSEVVTNAVVHAGTPVDLVVRSGRGRVQIEATDAGEQTPVMPDRAVGSERGRGMLIVAALAEAWGVVPAERGKTVWFRYHSGQPASPGSR